MTPLVIIASIVSVTIIFYSFSLVLGFASTHRNRSAQALDKGKVD